MEFPKNQWVDFEVEGVKIGRVIHVYEHYTKDITIPLGPGNYLIKPNAPVTNEYYTISLDSQYTDSGNQTISLDKDIFEKLAQCEFTRIVDYFIVARDILYVGDAHGLDYTAFSHSDDDNSDISYFTFHIANRGRLGDIYLACTKDNSEK